MPEAVLPTPCIPVCPCAKEGKPVLSSDNCLALSNICIFSLDTFGNLVPKIPCPGAPPCLRKTFPGYTLRSCPGTRLVSSTSINKLPDSAALSTDIRIKPFINVCVSSIFSAIPTPNILYGFIS